MKPATIDDIIKAERELVVQSFETLEKYVGPDRVKDNWRQYQLYYNKLHNVEHLPDLPGNYNINRLDREDFVLRTILKDYCLSDNILNNKIMNDYEVFR